MRWAYNNPQAVIDYLIRSSHVTAVAGKVILEHYYAQSAKKSYFMGCSAGGIQAMTEAERFPWDFDGIVAGAPVLSPTDSWMNLLWANRALTGRNGESLLDRADLEALHQAVVAKCDMNDGVKDGLIGDPRECRFRAAELHCTGSSTKHCLTDQQIEAVERIYAGPRTSTGTQIAMPSAQKASELMWLDYFGGSATNPTPSYNFIGDWFRYYLFQPNPGPTWEPSAFNFDLDYQRLGMAEISEAGNNPDLRRFAARGGKLLSFTGWNDPAEGVLRTVEYYDTAERIMGSRELTQNFFRLFTISGMKHCSGGEGPFAIDYLSYLEAWVERNEPPDMLIGFHPKAESPKSRQPKGLWELLWGLNFPLDPRTVEFSRPIYPYPTATTYLGHGNSASASSFGPDTRER
jgi:feruloyl esterase